MKTTVKPLVLVVGKKVGALGAPSHTQTLNEYRTFFRVKIDPRNDVVSDQVEYIGYAQNQEEAIKLTREDFNNRSCCPLSNRGEDRIECDRLRQGVPSESPAHMELVGTLPENLRRR